jgi:hypothetical protein
MKTVLSMSITFIALAISLTLQWPAPELTSALALPDGSYGYNCSACHRNRPDQTPPPPACIIDLSQASGHFSWNGSTYVMDILNLTAPGLGAFYNVRWELNLMTAAWELVDFSPPQLPPPGGGPADISQARCAFNGCQMTWSNVKVSGVPYTIIWNFNESYPYNWTLTSIH